MTATEARLDNETRSIWRLLLGIVDRPTATFKAVLARRTWRMWAVPLLMLFLCFTVMTVIGAPYGVEIARQQMQRQLDSMPPEQAEAAGPQIETFTSLPFILATGLGVGTIALIVGIVVQAALLYFTALVAGGEVEFGPVFTMSVWTRWPSALRSLVQAGYMILAKRAIQYPGLASLVATGDLMKDGQNPLVALLGRIDLFWLWHLLLVVLGLAVVARFSRSKALVLTVVYAALSLAIAVIPSLLAGGVAGG